MDAIQTTGTESTKAILKEQDIRQRIKTSAQQWWIRPIDMTTSLLREKGVFNTEEVMKVVRKLICEFYWINMWELQVNNPQFLMDKYWIPEDKFNTLREWNIALAYQDYVLHNNGDNSATPDKEIEDAPLANTTSIVDLPQEQIQKEEYRMLVANKQNLQQMMASETDKDKLELYEAQMKVLDLKLKNAANW